MNTVGELIARVLPRGTRGDRDGWQAAPLWPPDVFAVAASLLKVTEAYAHPDVRGGARLGQRHAQTTRAMGVRWAKNPLDEVLERWRATQWKALIRAWNARLDAYVAGERLARWVLAALRLLASADEAAEGVGFSSTTPFARAALGVSGKKTASTLTWFADPTEVVVQPKGRTPSVGCNLRSMSLNLAVLPPRTTVNSLHLGVAPALTADQCGVLLVPFPYVIENAWIGGTPVRGQRWGRLQFDPVWGRSPQPEALARFIAQLIRRANAAGTRVSMLILPELALSEAQHRAVWRTAKALGVRVLLCGVHAPQRNFAYGTLRGRTTDPSWKQKKHHRWRVERFQVANYGLPLDAKRSWWEDVDITDRTVVAARLHRSSTVACLVCEDLARVEPVQPVLREMGVNLLVALLMDGPQYRHRWSSKSATVFAEDPGSAVLTVTSVALMRRFHRFREKHTNPASSPIALWQDADGSATELLIEPDAHAVRFTIAFGVREEITLDGRRRTAKGQSVKLVRDPTGKPLFSSVTAERAPRWARPLFQAGLE